MTLTMPPAGKRVLVLEQNSYLGGGASTYQINGVDFDIGTYFVGQVSSVVERRQLDKHLLKKSSCRCNQKCGPAYTRSQRDR